MPWSEYCKDPEAVNEVYDYCRKKKDYNSARYHLKGVNTWNGPRLMSVFGPNGIGKSHIVILLKRMCPNLKFTYKSAYDKWFPDDVEEADIVVIEDLDAASFKFFPIN